MVDDFSDLAGLLDADESLPPDPISEPGGQGPGEDPDVLSFPSDPENIGGSVTGDGTCAICSAPVFRPPGTTPTGRKKRVPKYCDIHAKNTGSDETRPRSQKLETRLAAVQQELSDNMKLAGAIAGNVLPCTGYIMIEESDEFTAAVVRLARRHPKALAALEKAAEIGPGVKVGKTLVKIGVAMNVDGGRLAPDSVVSQYMGVERVYAEIHRDYRMETSFSMPAPAPRYSMVG